MKFLPEFGSCWGGAMVSPAAEVADGGRHAEEERGGNYHHIHGQAKSKKAARVKPSGSAATHWKPKLIAISEDSTMSEVNRGGARRLAGLDDGKRPLKVKPKSPAKAAPPPNHEEEYWKSSYTMALPAFSPTSFIF